MYFYLLKSEVIVPIFKFSYSVVGIQTVIRITMCDLCSVNTIVSKSVPNQLLNQYTHQASNQTIALLAV